jgi:hypothetical protein
VIHTFETLLAVFLRNATNWDKNSTLAKQKYFEEKAKIN